MEAVAGICDGMNWHQVIDERSYEMHQVIADILRESPGGLAHVSRWIEDKLRDEKYSEDGKAALREWQDVIRVEGVRGVLRVLDDRGDEATRMRQSTPFAVLMPGEKRQAIYQKYESLRTRTSLAGV
jgi:hypothetical protein